MGKNIKGSFTLHTGRRGALIFDEAMKASFPAPALPIVSTLGEKYTIKGEKVYRYPKTMLNGRKVTLYVIGKGYEPGDNYVILEGKDDHAKQVVEWVDNYKDLEVKKEMSKVKLTEGIVEQLNTAITTPYNSITRQEIEDLLKELS